jgi:hypothetical protein
MHFVGVLNSELWFYWTLHHVVWYNILEKTAAFILRAKVEKMQAAGSTETRVTTYRIAWYPIPKKL